jgi:hypothetical protein
MTLMTVESDAAAGTGPKPALFAANYTNDDAERASSRRPTGRRDKGFSAPSGSRRAATGAIDEY